MRYTGKSHTKGKVPTSNDERNCDKQASRTEKEHPTRKKVMLMMKRQRTRIHVQHIKC